MLRKILAPIDDDTEEAPWMVMGMPQFNTVTAFSDSLRLELRSRHQRFLVAGMLPIRYRPIPGGRIEQLAPDVLVAPVDDHLRSSYDVEREGVPPAFVLEVISPESWNRDLNTKPERYEVMGVSEYALYDPGTPDGRMLLDPPLQGYRRDPARDEFVRWETDDQGRLYSEVLELWLVVHEGALRAQRTDGSLVPTLEESERARDEERRLREQAEAEVVRLRAALERRAEER